MALHLLEGAGPRKPDGDAVLVLLVREVGRRARLAAFRGANIVVRCWLPDCARVVMARRLASRGCFCGLARGEVAIALRCEAAKLFVAFLVAP